MLDKWNLPTWLQHALLSLVYDRQVQLRRGNYRSPLRPLLRSIGMGGTVSPLLWCMGYDPIIETVAAAAAAPCPTYVDDLASLVEDAAQTLRVSIALPWASHGAGLLVETHQCKGLVVPANEPPNLAGLCANLPVSLTTRADGLPIIKGLTPDLVRRIIRASLGDDALEGSWTWHEPCRCNFKTALVPAAAEDWWKTLMAKSPFGASCVKKAWPYLGAPVTARCNGPVAPPMGRYDHSSDQCSDRWDLAQTNGQDG